MADTVPPPSQAGALPRLTVPAPLLLLAIHWIVLAIAWDGVGPRDALRYVEAAMTLAEGHVTETHWGLRWPLVAPMAVSIALLGPSELAASLPVFAWSSALVLLSWLLVHRWLGAGSALAVGALTAASGFYAMVGSGIYVFLPETVLCLGAIGLAAVPGAGAARRHAAAGGLIFAAWLCRETTGSLLPVLALGALVGIRPLRRGLRAAAAVLVTFAGLVAVEWTAYALWRGDPLHRVWIDLGHGRDQAGTELLPAGMVSFGSWIDPLVGIATQGILVPLHLALLPALAVLVLLRARPTTEGAVGLRLLAGGAAASFAIGVAVLNLETVFYFPLVPMLSTILVGWALGVLAARIGPALPVAAALALTLGNFAARDVTRSLRMDEARMLVALTRADGAPLATDTFLADRAGLLLRLEGRDPGLVRDFATIVDPAGWRVFDVPGYDGPMHGLPAPEGRQDLRRLPAPPPGPVARRLNGAEGRGEIVIWRHP
jgi:hypothetical protein